jgi:cytochrome P450
MPATGGFDPRLPADPEGVLSQLLDPEQRGDDLYPLLHQLRTLAPVFKTENPELQQAWVITRFSDDDTIARSRTFTSDKRVLEIFDTGDGGAFFEIMQTLMKYLDPPDHARVRGLVSRAFTPRSVERLRPRIQQIVNAQLERQLEAGEMDVVRDFAFPLPIIVICELLGVPVEDVDLFFRWSQDLVRRADVGSLDAERKRRGDEAAAGLRDYFLELIDERRARPRDDLVSALIAVEDGGDRLSKTEMVGASIILLLREAPELIGSACEEFLRYDTSVQITPKVATVDLSFHDRTIRAGEIVASLRGAVNRDPAQYADPDRLDIRRPDNHHHSFGVGPYHCLGASLARAEIQIAIGTLVSRLPGLALETEKPRLKPSLYLHGLESLQVSW